MKQVTITYKIYTFDELPKEKQEQVINSHINFLLDIVVEPQGNFKRAIDKANEMQTPWFTNSYVYDYCKDELIEELREKEYFDTGEIYYAEDY
jgi:hypothetical protein